jgi:hypothetical protein
MAKILINKKLKISVDRTEILSLNHETRNNFEKCWIEVRLKNGKTIISDRAWFDLIDEFEKTKNV